MHAPPEKVLDLRAVFGVLARVTTPASATGGEYVEMEITAEPGAATAIHRHPDIEETYEVRAGVLEVLFEDEWRPVREGASFSVPRGQVHAFRNSTDDPVRFLNRHAPAGGFEAHLETVDRLVREGKVRGVKDPRSLIYLALSARRHRPDRLVRPPQKVMDVLAWIGDRLGYRLE